MDFVVSGRLGQAHPTWLIRVDVGRHRRSLRRPFLCPLPSRPVLPYTVGMSDIRFDSIEDGQLADLWYALRDAAARHPERFRDLFDSVNAELLERRGAGLHGWLEHRFNELPFNSSWTENLNAAEQPPRQSLRESSDGR